MRRLICACVIGLSLIGRWALAAPPNLPAPVVMPPLPADAKPQPIAFSRLVSTLHEGDAWATFDFGLTCTLPQSGRNLRWETRDNNFDSRVYTRAFAEELKSAGFASAQDPDNLFSSRTQSDLKIAGNIKAINAKLCLFGLIIEDPDHPQMAKPGHSHRQHDLRYRLADIFNLSGQGDFR